MCTEQVEQNRVHRRNPARQPFDDRVLNQYGVHLPHDIYVERTPLDDEMARIWQTSRAPRAAPEPRESSDASVPGCVGW
jgi:hypothetical protein